MIFNNIAITNFGLYKGTYTIDLTPNFLEGKHITIVSGQNGVGKSTLQEALHLCLHGSLSIDSRISEVNYERHLLSRSYKYSQREAVSSLELSFTFKRGGYDIHYQVIRSWTNNPDNVNEDIVIWENNVELKDLNKKEKNFFLRELVQLGFAKIMFFDGEKLSALYEEGNLNSFIAETCKYLFGLNLVDLLKNDLNYYLNKVHSLQTSSENSSELKKIKEEIQKIEKDISILESKRNTIDNSLKETKLSISAKEDEISKHGRWVTKKVYKLKSERQRLEADIKNSKKELIEIYNGLGPFIFCKKLCSSLKDRLTIEREIERWEHAKELLTQKATDLKKQLKKHIVDNDIKVSKRENDQLSLLLEKVLLSKPENFSDEEIIYHKVSDSERNTLINWIDEIIETISKKAKEKSLIILRNEESLKVLTKEQASFSREDMVVPLIRELQELNKELGAQEQQLQTTSRRIEEEEKKKLFYQSRLDSLMKKLYQDENVDEKIRLSVKTRDVLDAYSEQLLIKKLQLLEGKALYHFNHLCRKENYFDQLIIDPVSFDIKLSKKKIPIDHKHLSAGEKQLLITSFIWGLRELANVSLPLIIDTPLARLDSAHRNSFINEFLPSIHPQVIMIGTDMEIMSDVFNDLKPYIVRHYQLSFDKNDRATKIEHGMLTNQKALQYEV